MAHSIAVPFGVGSAPGNARHTGHVCVFGSVAKVFGQRQNIFVCVLSWTWISSPTTGSHSGIEELLRLQQRHLDVAAHLEDREVLLERPVHADEAEFALASFERQTDVPELDCARAVEQTRTLAEDALDSEYEIGGAVDDGLFHLSRSGTVSKPIACSSAWPARNKVFSENWGPISCRPTGSPSDRP